MIGFLLRCILTIKKNQKIKVMKKFDGQETCSVELFKTRYQ
jgi:hypothetical protein